MIKDTPVEIKETDLDNANGGMIGPAGAKAQRPGTPSIMKDDVDIRSDIVRTGGVERTG